MKPAARRQARRWALQAIYQWQMTSAPIADIELQFVTENKTKDVDVDYFHVLITGVVEARKELDRAIELQASRPLDDIDMVDKAILRLAGFELSARQDVPYKVVINEAIELAKSFASEESHKFVNGVVDKLARKYRTDARRV